MQHDAMSGDSYAALLISRLGIFQFDLRPDDKILKSNTQPEEDKGNRRSGVIDRCAKKNDSEEKDCFNDSEDCAFFHCFSISLFNVVQVFCILFNAIGIVSASKYYTYRYLLLKASAINLVQICQNSIAGGAKGYFNDLLSCPRLFCILLPESINFEKFKTLWIVFPSFFQWLCKTR